MFSPIQEVVRDAIVRSCLPLAQAYLIQRGPQDVVSLLMVSEGYMFSHKNIPVKLKVCVAKRSWEWVTYVTETMGCLVVCVSYLW